MSFCVICPFSLEARRYLLMGIHHCPWCKREIYSGFWLDMRLQVLRGCLVSGKPPSCNIRELSCVSVTLCLSVCVCVSVCVTWLQPNTVVYLFVYLCVCACMCLCVCMCVLVSSRCLFQHLCPLCVALVEPAGGAGARVSCGRRAVCHVAGSGGGTERHQTRAAAAAASGQEQMHCQKEEMQHWANVTKTGLQRKRLKVCFATSLSVQEVVFCCQMKPIIIFTCPFW